MKYKILSVTLLNLLINSVHGMIRNTLKPINREVISHTANVAKHIFPKWNQQHFETNQRFAHPKIKLLETTKQENMADITTQEKYQVMSLPRYKKIQVEHMYQPSQATNQELHFTRKQIKDLYSHQPEEMEKKLATKSAQSSGMLRTTGIKLMPSVESMKRLPRSKEYDLINQWIESLPQDQKEIVQKIYEDYDIAIDNNDVTFEKAYDAMFSLMANPEKLQKLITSLKCQEPLCTLRHFEGKGFTQVPTKLISNYSEYDRALGEYTFSDRTIKLYRRFYEEAAPAKQLGLIYHEYRHHLQGIAGVLRKRTPDEAEKFFPYSVKDAAKKVGADLQKRETNGWMPTEQDAEHFAITHVTCPTCLKVIQANAYNKSARLQAKGYYGHEDFEPHIQLAEMQNNPTCPAHTKTIGDDDHNHTVQALKQALEKYKQNSTQELADQIKDLDKQTGGLLKHIPEFNLNIINAMTYHHDLLANLALNLKKFKEENEKQKEIKLLGV